MEEIDFESLNMKISPLLKSYPIEKQKEILDSIHYAKRIQSALMPNKLQLAKELNKAKRNGK